MKILSTCALLAAMATLTVGCKKDDSTPTASKTDMLTAKNWKVTADVTVATATGQAAVMTDNFATTVACERDNYFKFNADKTVIANEGTNVCSGSPQTANGVWDFNSDQTKLTMGTASSSGIVGQFDLKELSATTLKISVTDTYNGVTEVETLTFTAF